MQAWSLARNPVDPKALIRDRALALGFDAVGFCSAELGAEARARLAGEGLRVEAELAYGEPADEIVKWVTTRGCDLVAMSTHGHRFISDLLYGSTAETVTPRRGLP